MVNIEEDVIERRLWDATLSKLKTIAQKSESVSEALEEMMEIEGDNYEEILRWIFLVASVSRMGFDDVQIVENLLKQ